MIERKFRAIGLALLVLFSSLAIGLMIHKEHGLCMGVSVITPDFLHGYSEDYNMDIGVISLNGQKVAYDYYSSTIYISQPKTSLSKYYKLSGTLRSDNSEYELYFIDNKALNHINSAVKQSFPLTLVMLNEKSFMQVKVIITTLPVMSLQSDIFYDDYGNAYTLDEEGTLCLWSGYDKGVGGYTTKTVRSAWRIRGNTTSVQPKTPWKLTLKNDKGENSDMEFLGLGSDDDWILNCLTMDDTRIKEKLFMDMWNEMAADTDYNFKMSTGEYVELIKDNEYLGLFLLQRRLDAKYLGLDDNDALVKSTDYTANTVEEAYEFVTESENTEEIYEMLENSLYGIGDSNYNLYNVIDTNLTLQLTAARDNFSKKNMYHVLKYTDGKYENFLVPWDTDQSMGVVFNDGFKYEFSTALAGTLRSKRMETDSIIKTYPNYYELASNRLKELRSGVYSNDNIQSVIDSINTQITESGALERDTELWGNRYYGEDTVENLKAFMYARGKMLDNYYSNY